MLGLDKDAYRFVLVDEAHAFRNPDTEQYRALSRLMGGTEEALPDDRDACEQLDP